MNTGGILNNPLVGRIRVLWRGQLALILGVKYLVLRLGLRGEVRGINGRSIYFYMGDERTSGKTDI